MTNTIVRITTDDGNEGVGGVSNYTSYDYDRYTCETLRHMIPELVGKDPLSRETLWSGLWPRVFPLPPQAQGLFPEGNPLPLDNMIPGFVEGATKMQKGGKYQLRIPANMAYGDEEKTNPQTGEVVIPANSDLIFDVDMIDFMTRAEFERRVQVITQMMQQQGGMMGPADGAAPPPQ